MQNRFNQIVSSTQARSRWLRSLNACGWTLAVSIAGTFGYVLGSAFQILPELPWIWLLAGNGIAGIAGWIYGWQRTIDIGDALFQIDRKLGLGEKLTTLYELKAGPRESDFLPMLEERVAHLNVDPNQVFTLSVRDKQRWIGIGAGALGSLIVLLLWSDLTPWGPTVSILQRDAKTESTKDLRFQDPEAEKKPLSMSKEPPSSPEALAARLNELNKRLKEITKDPLGNPQARRDELAQLAREAQELENSLWGNNNPGKPGSSASSGQSETGQPGSSGNPVGAGQRQGQSGPADQAGEDRAKQRSFANQQRQQAEEQKQNLQELKEKLEQDQLSVKELRDILRTRKDSGDPELEKALEEAESAPDEETAADALARAIENLSRKQETDQRLRDLQNELAKADGPPSENQAGSSRPGQNSKTQQPQRGRNSDEDEDGPDLQGIPQGKGQGSIDGYGTDPSEQETGQTDEETNAPISKGGDSAGLNAGGDPLGAETKIDQLPATSEMLDMSGHDLPDLDILMSFMTQGVPLENVTSATGSAPPRLLINYAKVNTALDLLGVPPELREEILSYFLSLSNHK